MTPAVRETPPEPSPIPTGAAYSAGGRSPVTPGAIRAAAAAAVTTAGTATGTAPTGPNGDFLSGLVLLVRRLFFNQVPTAEPVQAMVRPSGQAWGFLAARDPEWETITYSVSQNPRLGDVVITENGAYIYTPGTDFAGTDSFTVTLQNPGFHVNLLDLFAPPRRDVTVTVTSLSASPSSGHAGHVVDTFDGASGSAPDDALWGYHLGPYRDDGIQTYTNYADNVRLDGQGNLVIQAHKTADGDHTSTRLVTQDKLAMQYGVVQARIKMPAGQGIWPAFWMLGTSYYPENWTIWPECGEIDIMEVVNTGTVYNVALHGPQGDTDYYGGAAVSGRFVGSQGPISAVAPINDLTEDFHDYWLMWNENHIVIGVDDTLLDEFTPASLPPQGQWVFNQPMYAILQIAVGGPWPGPPDETTTWPATMLVDSFSYTPLPGR